MIVVRLPAVLRRPEMERDLHLDASVATINDLIAELERRYPGLAFEMDDAIYNFAVNDALVLHGARGHRLHDGDEVEVIPTIAGGEA